MKLKINKRRYDLTKQPFVIAEIGHNHQGSIKIAKQLILSAKESGASAVKFQKRNNKKLYTKELYDQIYDHPNSYAKTYGKHREALEFSFKQFKELSDYAKKIDIIFFATPFDFDSVDFLEKLKVPCYKIASADLVNIPLQNYIASKNKTIFLSTGGGNMSDVLRAYNNIYKKNKKLAILHCTASYPAEIKDMNLRVIEVLKKKFPKIPIGLSDHENGIDAAPIAYMLGARIFEKHFTLNRAWKGTDQAFSLEPQGLKKLVRNLNRIETLLGSKNKSILPSELNPIKKMAKSIVASKYLEKDHIIKIEDLAFKSPGGGLKPYLYKSLINKKTKKIIKIDEKIKLSDLK